MATKEDSPLEFIKIGVVNNPADLSLVKSLLESEDIVYYISNENFSNLYGAADGLTSMDIMVRQDDSERAKDILKDFAK
jgi:hypothetical protein